MSETAIDILNGIKSGVDALQKENAELRERLKEACHKACEECMWKHFDSDDCRGEIHEDCECHKWRAALEGVNHAND